MSVVSVVGLKHFLKDPFEYDFRKLNAKLATTQDEQQFKYQLGLSYWTMDIADPDELVTFAVDPGAGAKSFYTDYNNPDVIAWTHQAEKTFSAAGRQKLYSQIQAQAAQDAFMVFMYYSPYRYAMTSKVHGFLVYPTGNFHMEDTWLSH